MVGRDSKRARLPGEAGEFLREPAHRDVGDRARNHLRPAALAVLALALLVAFTVHGASDPDWNGCETEEDAARWLVKTARDPLAAGVERRARAATVEELGRLPRPARGELGNGRLPLETRRYRVLARLVGFWLAPDGDLHMTVADPRSGRRMFVEFPKEPCARAAAPALGRAMLAARRDAMGVLGRKAHTPVGAHGLVVVEGVLFFDPRDDDGVGVELHPVLAFRRLERQG